MSECNVYPLINDPTNSSHAETDQIPSQLSNDAFPIKTNFMDLPRELRDMVYYLTLVPRPGHLTHIRYADATPERQHFNAEPVKERPLPELTRMVEILANKSLERLPDVSLILLLVSKRVKLEAEEVFYRHSRIALRIRCYQTNYGIFVWKTGCGYSFIHVKQYFCPSVFSNICHLSMDCAVSDSPITTADQALVGRPGSNPDPEITRTLCLGKSPGYFDTWLYCTWKQKIDFVTAMPALRETNVCMCDCRWRDSNYVCSINASGVVLRMFEEAVTRRLVTGLPNMRVVLESFYEVYDADSGFYKHEEQYAKGKNYTLSIIRTV